MKRLIVLISALAGCLMLAGCVNGQVAIPTKKPPVISIAIADSGIAVGQADDKNPVMILEEYSCPSCAEWEKNFGDGLNGAIMGGRLTVVFMPVDVKNPARSLLLSARLYDIAKTGVPLDYLKARQEIMLMMLAPDKGESVMKTWPTPSSEGLEWAGRASQTNIQAAVKATGVVKTPSFSRDITDEVQ